MPQQMRRPFFKKKMKMAIKTGNRGGFFIATYIMKALYESTFDPRKNWLIGCYFVRIS